MIKTIKIDENHELTLSNNIGWAMTYREQFGHDIIPDLLPIVSAVISVMGEAKKFDISKIDGETLRNALVDLAGLQFVDFINLIWAMAKTADEKTPSPAKWVRQFDTFPLDIIAPEAFSFLVEGLMSSKNFQGLNLAEALKK